MKKIVYSIMAVLFMISASPVFGIDIFVKTGSGEIVSFDVDPGSTVGSLIEQVDTYLESKEALFTPYYFDFSMDDSNEELVCKANFMRDYYKEPTPSQIEDMQYIVLTLGNEPLLKLKKFESSLKNAGDRIDEVHPLHFWRIIFTNNDTLSAIHSIKKRRFVWRPFIKGMGDSLQEAADRNNLEQDNIDDFARKIGVSKELFEAYLYKMDWEGFAKALLTHVPLPGGLDRYDQ